MPSNPASSIAANIRPAASATFSSQAAPPEAGPATVVGSYRDLS